MTLGPVDIESLYIVAGIDNGAFPVELSAAISGQLGPLAASVDRLGAVVTLSFPPGGGNIGPGQVDVAFKPPTGVGLSIDLAVITGGGFLSIDAARGEYSGALQFELAGFVGVTAIGLLNTKNPDGTPGFSLLVILTADFGPGIQLGFGFTLNAVGGLLGLNRTMLFQPLMDAVRSGAIDSIMFPQDVIANAPKIISDLRAIFPPQQGTFLIGPMAKLGWGEPTLVSVSLGVIIVIPPGDIAILGVLRLALPADDVAILELQVNFAGALEFSKSRLYFFASLYDSHLLFITIQGEMGLLVAWGDDANFVVSVGGFHPRFSPPPLPFPTPQRIEVDLINESYARIRATGYFAVTTNTVQFGSTSDMFFGFSALSVQGHSSFDALIQFSPFHFTVEISTSFSVNVFGVGVWGLGIDLTLEGPTPWHAHGTASISLLFFSIGVDIDVTWGDDRDTSLPPVAVLPILSAEFGKRTNWKAVPPSSSGLLVSLRQLDPGDTDLVLHPVGSLQVSQRLVPLDLTLTTSAARRRATATGGRWPSPPPPWPRCGTCRNRSHRPSSRTPTTPRSCPSRPSRRKTAASSSHRPGRPSAPPRPSPGPFATTSPSSTRACSRRNGPGSSAIPVACSTTGWAATRSLAATSHRPRRRCAAPMTRRSASRPRPTRSPASPTTQCWPPRPVRSPAAPPPWIT